MSRPLRIEFPNAVYHVTGRGNARQRIYRTGEDCEHFLSILSHVVKRYGWLCHAYCLMDNHYHLLIETPGSNLSFGMRQLNGVYTQAYNRCHRRVGHLFQGRYKSILVEKEPHLLELCRYVVLNPVRARMVKHPGKWKWSSYRAMAGEARVPEYLSVDWLLGQFGHRLHSAQKAYREYVRGGLKSPSPWTKLRGQIYLGGERFVKKHQPDRPIRDIPRKQTHAHRPSLKSLFSSEEDIDKIIQRAYVRHRYRLREIGQYLGMHESTISRRLRRVENRDA